MKMRRTMILAVWLWGAGLTVPASAAAPDEGPLPVGTQTPDRRQRHALEREQRQRRFEMRLDSLASSGEFQFLPISMEQEPDGSLQMINNYYYYIGIFKSDLQVHIPVMRGRAVEYPVIANFDTDRVFDFQTSQTKFGWETSFSAEDGKGNVYTFNFNIYTATGETVLDLRTGPYSIKYIGSIVPNEVEAGVP